MRCGVSGSSALAVLTVGTAAPLPTLDALAADPGLAVQLSPEARQALILRTAAALAALAAAGPIPGLAPAPASPPTRDEWIGADEVGRRFSLTRRWLEDHSGLLRRLKIVAAPSRKVRLYHVGRLARFLEARTGSPPG